MKKKELRNQVGTLLNQQSELHQFLTLHYPEWRGDFSHWRATRVLEFTAVDSPTMGIRWR